MLEQLKKEVYEANMELQEKGLVIYTWGNVSGIDRENNLVVIKPSGVEYDELSPEDMVVVDFDQNVVEGRYRPSSDTATHIELYKAFDNLGRYGNSGTGNDTCGLFLWGDSVHQRSHSSGDQHGL